MSGYGIKGVKYLGDDKGGAGKAKTGGQGRMWGTSHGDCI